MALESFYGGKQGVSPVIKAKYKYINENDPAYQARINSKTKLTKEEAIWLNDALGENSYNKDQEITWTKDLLKPFTMDECLKDVNYTEVWYGELCIIDTDSKTNPNNGKLYRRTLKQVDNKTANTDDTLYAEYIGQIVGPSGGIPKFDFGSLNVEREKAIGTKATTENDIAPLENSNWDYSYPTEDENNDIILTTNVPDDIEDIAILSAATPGGDKANIQMKPGKDIDGNYTDTIKYTWCNVRRRIDGEDDDAWIYLGFEIPYSWFDVERTEIQYWDPRTNLLEHSQKGTDNKEHPFYHNLHFYIPRGARGIGPEELFIVGKDNQNKPSELYDFDSIDYNQETDTYFIKENSTWITPTEKTYWVAKWRLYNPKTTDITDIYQYIGAYKDIKSVQLLNNGKLQIQYSDSNIWYDLGTITWIDNVNVVIDTDSTKNTYGNFTITIEFNSDKSDYVYENNLHLIKNVTYNDSTGQIKFDYSDINGGTLSKTTGNIEYDKNITINDTPTSDDYGKVTITKNTGISRTETILPLIKNSSYDESTGIITFNYSGNVTSTAGPLSYISKMKVLENGTLQYQFNTESSDNWHTITDGTENPKDLKIKDIKDANINNTGHLIITYRDDTIKDVGQVKGNTIAGIVYTLQNSNNTDDFTFESTSVALNDLQGKTFKDNEPTSIGGNGDGRIKVNTNEVTGGLVAASIKEEGKDSSYSAIFYYDKQDETWKSAGTIGGNTDNQSNIYIEGAEPRLPVPDFEPDIWPQEGDRHPEFYFKNGGSDGSVSFSPSYNGQSIDFNYNNYETLGYLPWQNAQVEVQSV